MDQRDWLWPTQARLEREVQDSWRKERRRERDRRRRERQEFLLEAVVFTALSILAVFFLWLIAPAWYPQ